MGKKIRGITSGPRSLKPQLVIAFCLMSVIPILALLNLIFPSFFSCTPMPVILGMVVILALLGFWLVKRIVDSIIEIKEGVRVIASGELSHTIDVNRQDEIGELGQALNALAQHIKNNMDELKIYGERTKDINVQINKQVLALSGLLQISNLITKTSDLDEIFGTAIAKLMQAASSSMAFLVLKKDGGFETVASSGLRADALTGMKLPSNAYLFKNFLAAKKPIQSDHVSGTHAYPELMKLLEARNLVVCPVVVQGSACGLVGVGNQLENFAYTQDDIELINLFAKQLSIAVENSYLTNKVKELEVHDVLTDLYNRRYIMTWLDEEVLRAISHQKPCSFIAVRITNFKEIYAGAGKVAAEDILVKIAEILRGMVTPFERAARIQDNEFGIVLSEMNKRQAQDKAVVIRSKIDEAFKGMEESRRPHIWIGVVENPIDGIDAASLFQKIHELT